MSVINKMLKDLEQRHDDTELDDISSVYQAPAKNPIKYIVVALSVVVIGLIVTVSWLLLKNNSSTLTVSNSEQQVAMEQQTSKPKLKTITIKPLKTAAEKAQIKERELEQVLNDYTPEKPPQILEKPEPMVPVVVTPKKTQKAADKPKATSKAQAKAQPKAKPKSETKSELSIVKSSEQYSPQERLEQLMKKAQAAFDKGYVSEAIEKLNKVLSISDGHIEARNLLSVAWYGRGELQQAVSIINDGLSRYPNVEVWRMTAAKIYFKENNMKGAFSYLDINLSNGSLDFYSMKASVARKLENYPSAESAYLMLTKLQPDVGNWWLGHAISLDSQGKFDEAILSYQTVIAKGGISSASMTFVQGRIKELEV